MLLLYEDREAQTCMKMATIRKPLGKWLKGLFKINGATIEGLIGQVLFATCRFRSHLGLFYLVKVILEMNVLRTSSRHCSCLVLEARRHERDFLKICRGGQNVVINVSFVAVNHECSQCLIYLEFVYSHENSYYRKRNLHL